MAVSLSDQWLNEPRALLLRKHLNVTANVIRYWLFAIGYWLFVIAFSYSLFVAGY